MCCRIHRFQMNQGGSHAAVDPLQSGHRGRRCRRRDGSREKSPGEGHPAFFHRTFQSVLCRCLARGRGLPSGRERARCRSHPEIRRDLRRYRHDADRSAVSRPDHRLQAAFHRAGSLASSDLPRPGYHFISAVGQAGHALCGRPARHAARPARSRRSTGLSIFTGSSAHRRNGAGRISTASTAAGNGRSAMRR